MKITTLVENDLADKDSGLAAEFGLSLYIEHRGHRILFDTGAAGAAVRNAERLGIDLGAVDAVVLSHHHFDHGGGLPAFFAANERAPVYLRRPPEGRATFHAMMVVNRYIGLEEGLLERYADRFHFVDAFTEILPGACILTDIVQRHPRPKGDDYLYLTRSDGRVHDSFDHELIFALNDDDGWVVFTGCGHNGVLNMVATVAEHFPAERIKGVVGGFHLVGMPVGDTMAGTEREMQQLGQAMMTQPVGHYWTGHCTGHKAYAVLKGVLGDRMDEFHTGTAMTV